MTGFSYQSFSENALKSQTYYFDADKGSDQNNGLSIEKPLKSLSGIGSLDLNPGDELMLKRGSVFSRQTISLNNLKGTATDPISINAYGKGANPIVDLDTLNQYAIKISGCENIEIQNLEIKGGGGGIALAWIDQKTEFKNFIFRNLYIHHCFLGNAYGFALNLIPKGKSKMSEYANVNIENCKVEMITKGFIHGEGLKNCNIIKNDFDYSGGPGIVIGKSSNLVIRENQINSSGSRVHKSFNGRGSCAWIILCKNVLVENNLFENANGWLDSYGFHADINNSDVVVQYNLSRNNAGGFIQILGKNNNCAYRYNISINDGWRVKGVFDHPTEKNTQSGCVISLFGFVANGTFEGPFNSYIYNNTIYVNDSIEAGFNIRGTVKGTFIANNIFHIMGSSKEIAVFQSEREPVSKPENIIFKNNLYLKNSNFPSGMLVDDSQKIIGDAGFKKSGGVEAIDYIPSNRKLIQNKSIAITNIPGDEKGLSLGFEVQKDFFGNPIVDTPDLGAAEIK
jgi:hypothetical protein